MTSVAIVMRGAAGALALLTVAIPLAGAISADAPPTFRKLTGVEIRTRVVGNRLTDEAHWSEFFNKDGSIAVVSMGRESTGSGASIRTSCVCGRAASTASATRSGPPVRRSGCWPRVRTSPTRPISESHMAGGYKAIKGDVKLFEAATPIEPV